MDWDCNNNDMNDFIYSIMKFYFKLYCWVFDFWLDWLFLRKFVLLELIFIILNLKSDIQCKYSNEADLDKFQLLGKQLVLFSYGRLSEPRLKQLFVFSINIYIYTTSFSNDYSKSIWRRSKSILSIFFNTQKKFTKIYEYPIS